ncbi:Uncharacterised protein [Elizabethkingia miricola]|nr:Uncharacterised protein [Elizabethkingia miricola]
MISADIIFMKMFNSPETFLSLLTMDSYLLVTGYIWVTGVYKQPFVM